MRYFIDTEFIEGFHKPLFGKKRHFIDLISIGIVCEDGRSYYGVSNEFDSKDADQWVRENVVGKLYTEDGLKLNPLAWKSNKQIAEDIIHFIGGEPQNPEGAHSYPEFYAYYADYDWVLFCPLFGRMIDLPKGYPMYCRDLKQMLDEAVMIKARSVEKALIEGVYPVPTQFRKPINLIFDEMLSDYKNAPEYPKQGDEHNALDDAKWNLKLYEFLKLL